MNPNKLLIKVYKYLKGSSIKCIDLRNTRHYCGFIYGSNHANFYYNYINGLHNGLNLEDLRSTFVKNLVWFKPKNFNDLFFTDFSTEIPLWCYPWSHDCNIESGWQYEIDSIPDIITHFNEDGIRYQRIIEEFQWLENAYYSIKKEGYQPIKHNFIKAIELSKDGKSVFILDDGNHRASALCALGEFKVNVRVINNFEYNSMDTWKKNSIYSKNDVELLFDCYFDGVKKFYKSSHPAKVLY